MDHVYIVQLRMQLKGIEIEGHDLVDQRSQRMRFVYERVSQEA